MTNVRLNGNLFVSNVSDRITLMAVEEKRGDDLCFPVHGYVAYKITPALQVLEVLLKQQDWLGVLKKLCLQESSPFTFM